MQTVFIKNEWREIAKLAAPGMTNEQFNAAWDTFLDLKAKGLLTPDGTVPHDYRG